jgi:molecular chaperone GrpE
MKIPIKKSGIKREMSKHNGKTDVEEQPSQNAEQELPPADPNDGFEEKTAAAAVQNGPAAESVAEPQPPQSINEAQKLRAERDSLFDRLARLQAEFDNYRKRASRENAEFRDYAVADAVRSLIPVVDNFTLALKNAQANPDEFRKGVELIQKQLQEALQKIGVQRVPAEGQPFDPRVHEAIEVVESNQVPDNHVLEELQPGYKIKDRLLRPAMVRVAKNNTSVN